MLMCFISDCKAVHSGRDHSEKHGVACVQESVRAGAGYPVKLVWEGNEDWHQITTDS